MYYKVIIWLSYIFRASLHTRSTEDLRAEIESITVSLLRKKQDLYRQHGRLTDFQMVHYQIK